MADSYKDPSLLNWYCCKGPICRNDQLATEMDDIRGLPLRLPRSMGDTDAISQEIAEIAKDGVISEDEKPKMQEAMRKLERSVSSHRTPALLPEVPR